MHKFHYSKAWHDSEKEGVMPSLSEQELVKDYVLNHTLSRPKNNLKQLIVYAIIFEAVVIALCYLISSQIDGGVKGNYLPGEALFFIINISLGLLIIKRISLFFIKLYQHYAPNYIRRRCCLMPTCSEYAILSIKKHGAIIGLWRTYIRVTKVCTGDNYRIDYP